MIPRTAHTETARTWAALPLVIGQRLIGLIAFWREELIPPDEWTTIAAIVQTGGSIRGSQHYLF